MAPTKGVHGDELRLVRMMFTLGSIKIPRKRYPVAHRARTAALFALFEHQKYLRADVDGGEAPK